ncbi:MAG: tetratricopeptide repeat protein [Anaerolineales bacterium]|nr:tetratricopeptide repeat protein [Anaerolineales bacterium]
MSQLRVYLFGAPRLEREDEAIKISLRKALALLAYLAMTQQSHSRDALATLFWPDDRQRKARANLRRALSRINTALGEGQLAIDRENAGLNPKADLWLDVDQFQRRLAQCQAHGHASIEVCPHCLPDLTAAAELYTGDFLAGFSLPDCPGFDEWQFFQSEGLRQALASVLERLGRGHSDRGDHDLAISYARRWLALDPLHEPAHRRLMELYAQTGQQAAALRQYEECVRVLDKEIGIPPSAETTALFELVKAKRAPPRPSPKAKKAPLSSRPVAPPHNLPPRPTPFIGREEELAEITRRLTDSTCRLLTLVGPGGIGKTRLAMAAAERQLDPVRFPNGVYFVSLAPVSGAEFLISTLADALNVSFFGQTEPKAHLLNYLREKQMLLVLDNFEHLLADQGTQLLTDIMRTAFPVKLLVTSRVRLHLQEEWVIDLQGLPFPDEESHEPPDSFSAVQLFLQRARQARSDFVLAKDESLYVKRICQLVEGMPLALELAAAWVRLMSCQEIAQEIERNLDFLSTPLRNMPDRHRSLGAVFDHSWHYLSRDEQRVFRGLTVFRGGFTREAAEQVAGASLPLLAALVDKSMLRRNDSGRYELHELLRQYGAEKLDEAGEADQIRSRHLEFFLNLAEEAEPKLQGAEQATWLKKLNTENGNLRAALAWSLEGGDADMGLRLAATLGEFWFMRGQLFGEGIEWLERVLSGVEATEPTRARARAFRRLGMLTELQGNYAAARSAFEQSLVLYRELGDKEGIAASLNYLGETVATQGYEVAARLLFAAARSAYEESLASLRQQGDQWRIARALNVIGEIARIEDDYAAAHSFYEESLALRRELGDTRGIAVSLINLGLVALHQGDDRQAATYFEESLPLFQKLGSIRGIIDCLAGLAGVAEEKGQPERAARLFGAVEAQREAIQTGLAYADRIEEDRHLDAVRAQLDESTFAVAWTEGRAMTLEQAVDYALRKD